MCHDDIALMGRWCLQYLSMCLQLGTAPQQVDTFAKVSPILLIGLYLDILVIFASTEFVIIPR